VLWVPILPSDGNAETNQLLRVGIE
jgi:hypothetical protein